MTTATATSEPAISATGIVKTFGPVTALAGLDLAVPAGTVLGLLGPNGSGKTTLVRILTTLSVPDSGSARVLGLDVVHDAAAVRRCIGLAGQFSAVDDHLTGFENLFLAGRLYHLDRATSQDRADELLDRLDLTEARDRRAKTYSGGMRRRLDLAAALVARPAVLFLDEPTTGLDPRSRNELWSVIRDLVADGTTLLLTTQYLDEADQLADRIVVIDRGLVIASGTSRELKDQVGGDVLEIRVSTPATVEAVESALAPIAKAPPSFDPATGTVRVPVGSAGSSVLVDAVRRLDAAGIAVDDLALRRPSLDDVFLALTGHAAEEAADGGSGDERSRGARRGRPRRGRSRTAVP